MSENIVLGATITIPNGPKMTLNRTLTVEAYDKIDVTVPSGADVTVDLQPSAAGKVLFLLVTCDWYGAELSYKANSAAGTPYALDEPHLLTGKGAVAMLESAAAISKLLFSNTTAGPSAKDAKVQILVGRDATP